MSDRPRAGRILGLCSVSAAAAASLLALFMFAFAGIVASRMLGAPQLAGLLRIGAGVVFFTGVNGYLTGVLAGLERYALVARAGVIAGTIYVALCVGGAYEAGLRGAVTGLALSALAQAAVLFVCYRQSLRAFGLVPAYDGLKSERRVVTRFVIPGLISGLTAVPALWLAQVYLSKSAGGFAEVAKYSAAYSLAMIVLFIPNVAYNVGMSLINHARGTRSERDYRSVFWTNMQFTAVIVALGAVGMVLFGKLLLAAYGSSFTSAYPVLLVLLAATLPESLTIAMFQLIQTNDRIWDAVLTINVPRDVLIPTMAYLLAGSYGAFGVALAYLTGRLLAFGLSLLLCWRIGFSLGDAPPTLEVPT